MSNIPACAVFQVVFSPHSPQEAEKILAFFGENCYNPTASCNGVPRMWGVLKAAYIIRSARI